MMNNNFENFLHNHPAMEERSISKGTIDDRHVIVDKEDWAICRELFEKVGPPNLVLINQSEQTPRPFPQKRQKSMVGPSQYTPSEQAIIATLFTGLCTLRVLQTDPINVYSAENQMVIAIAMFDKLSTKNKP